MKHARRVAAVLQTMALGLAACEVEGERADADAPARDGAMEARLDQAPHAITLDAAALESTWMQTLDLRALAPERAHVLFLTSPLADQSLLARDPVTGARIAEAEPYTILERPEGSLHVSRLELVKGLEEVELVGELQLSPDMPHMMLCDVVVTKHGDFEPGSLRFELVGIRDGASVCFDPRTFAQDPNVQVEDPILIPETVHIHGGPTQPRLISVGAVRLLNLLAGGSTLDDLVLEGGGTPGEGGLLRAVGDLHVERVAFRDGAAAQGGAIYSAGGRLTLVDSEVANSEAWHGGGIYKYGGALELRGTAVYGNRAELGGGVFVDDARMVLRAGSTLMDNEAEASGGGAYFRVLSSVGDSLIWNASVIANTAEADGGAIYLEGGRLVVDSNPAVPLQNVIDGNAAFGRGGGVFVDATATFELRGDTRVIDNAATQGGGVYTLGDVTLFDTSRVNHNFAVEDGGGVFVEDGQTLLRGVATVQDNVAGTIGGGIRWVGGLLGAAPSFVFGNVPDDFH